MTFLSQRPFRATGSAPRRHARRITALVAALALSCLASRAAAQDRQTPHLRRQGTATQLIVDGKPFLIRGGELGNSSASSLTWLAPHWKTFRDLRLNAIVAPVYWDLVEAEEGRFDWTLVDGLIAEARKNEMRLVLLWFGSWKNSMSPR
jgi:beta-galactosidase GanA